MDEAKEMEVVVARNHWQIQSRNSVDGLFACIVVVFYKDKEELPAYLKDEPEMECFPDTGTTTRR